MLKLLQLRKGGRAPGCATSILFTQSGGGARASAQPWLLRQDMTPPCLSPVGGGKTARSIRCGACRLSELLRRRKYGLVHPRKTTWRWNLLVLSFPLFSGPLVFVPGATSATPGIATCILGTWRKTRHCVRMATNDFWISTSIYQAIELALASNVGLQRICRMFGIFYVRPGSLPPHSLSNDRY